MQISNLHALNRLGGEVYNLTDILLSGALIVRMAEYDCLIYIYVGLWHKKS